MQDSASAVTARVVWMGGGLRGAWGVGGHLSLLTKSKNSSSGSGGGGGGGGGARSITAVLQAGEALYAHVRVTRIIHGCLPTHAERFLISLPAC